MRVKPTGELRQRIERRPDKDHLAFIRTLPCLTCEAQQTPTEAAHIRYADPTSGMGRKSHDALVVPLCGDCHRGPGGQHSRGERQWWEEKGIDPVRVAAALKAVSGNEKAALTIILREKGMIL
jgi:hypothetical protein